MQYHTYTHRYLAKSELENDKCRCHLWLTSRTLYSRYSASCWYNLSILETTPKTANQRPPSLGSRTSRRGNFRRTWRTFHYCLLTPLSPWLPRTVFLKPSLWSVSTALRWPPVKVSNTWLRYHLLRRTWWGNWGTRKHKLQLKTQATKWQKWFSWSTCNCQAFDQK